MTKIDNTLMFKKNTFGDINIKNENNYRTAFSSIVEYLIPLYEN